MSEELWVIRGNRPVIWSIPFWVNWHLSRAAATIHPALPLYGNQTMAYESVLRPVAKPSYGMWVIGRAQLERIGYKASGRPEELLVWERAKSYQSPEQSIPELEDHDDFIDGLYQRGMGKSREEAALWFRAICNHAFSLVVMQDKTVDLGFIKLHPCRYRMNWKSILLKRFPMLGMATSKLNGPMLDYILKTSGFDGEMVCGDLLAYHRKGYIYRYVEVEHTRQWFKAVESVETERLRAMGQMNYAKYVLDSIKLHVGKFTRLYRFWLAHLSRPTAKDDPGPVPGMFRWIRNTRNVERKMFEPGHPDTVVCNKVTGHTPSSHPLRLYAKTLSVRDLRALQLEPEKLRAHGPDVVQPPESKDGADGVRVRDAGESNA